VTLSVKDVVPILIGAICGPLIYKLLPKRKAKPELPPAPVVAMWALAGQMTEGQQKITVIQRGSKIIADIKAIRKVCPDLGLVGAKYIVDHVPQVVCAGLTPEEAEVMKQELELSGMTVEVS
jgi:ribosomal protein L7/L12